MGTRGSRAAALAVACAAVLTPSFASAQVLEPPAQKRVLVCLDAETCLDPVAVDDPLGTPATPASDVCTVVNPVEDSQPEGLRVPLGEAEVTLCEQENASYLEPDFTVVRLDVGDESALSFREYRYLSHGGRWWNSQSSLQLGGATVEVDQVRGDG